MVTDIEHSFPYVVTKADRQSAAQAMTNPDSQPLIKHGGAARPTLTLKQKLLFPLATFAFFVFFLVIDPDSRTANEPSDPNFPVVLGLGIVLLFGGFVGFFLLAPRASPHSNTVFPTPERFLITEHGIVWHWPHMMRHETWTDYKDYRDSVDVLVVLFRDRAGGAIIPLRDIPLDRREEFRAHLQKAFGGKPA